MKRVGALAVGALLVLGVLWGVAAVTTLGAAPGGLSRWLPLPALCVGARCLTYRGMAARVGDTAREAQVLQNLTRYAVRAVVSQVGRRVGLAVSDEEVGQALRAVRSSVDRSPELSAFVTDAYGGIDAATLRDGMRDLLLLQKLEAAGITDVWSHASAPRVRVFNLRYRWDATTHQIVPR